MTRAPWRGETAGGAIKPRAILSRLLVALALMLFDVPQGHAGGTPAHVGPVAQGKCEQALGVPSAQRRLPRAQHSGDDQPDPAAPGAAEQTLQLVRGAAISPPPHRSPVPVAIRILPPVRGPPEG